MTTTRRPWLFAACVAALTACGESDDGALESGGTGGAAGVAGAAGAAGASGAAGTPAPVIPSLPPDFDTLTPIPETSAGTELGCLCEVLLSCGCEGSEELTLEQCEAYFASLAAQAAAEDADGVTYDGACVARVVAAYEYLGCTTPSQVYSHYGLMVAAAELNGCKMYYGEKALGESCRSLESRNGDDCLPDLACVGEICRKREHAVQENQRCEEQSECEPGLFCLPAASGPESQVCSALPEPPEACSWGVLCAPGAWCEGGATCTSLPDAGESCAQERDVLERRCVPEAFCRDGTCEALPIGGQACAQGECAPGFDCESDTCVPQAAAICAGGPFPLFPEE